MLQDQQVLKVLRAIQALPAHRVILVIQALKDLKVMMVLLALQDHRDLKVRQALQVLLVRQAQPHLMDGQGTAYAS